MPGAPRPRQAWDKALASIDVDAPATMRTQFYTALYHAMLSPTLSMDVNGEYRGPDHQVHQARTPRASTSIPPGRCGTSTARSSR